MDTMDPKDQEALNRARTKGGCSNLREWVHHNGTFSYDQNHPDQSSGGGNQAESSTLAAKDLWQTPDVGSVAGGRSARGQSEPHKASLEKQAQWATPRSCSAMGATITPESVWHPDRFPNLETQVGQSQWPTPRGHEACQANSQDNGVSLSWAVQRGLKTVTDQWMTPRSCEWKGNGPNSQQQGLCNQVNWGTPNSRDWKGSPSEKMEGQKSLPRDLLKTNGSGKLNPRWVETLMGLPIGWTMPSCANPWTIALTNSDSSEMALTQM